MWECTMSERIDEPSAADCERQTAQMGVLRHGYWKDLTSPLLPKDLRTTSPDLARDLVASEVWKHCDLSSLPSWIRDREAASRRKHGTFSVRLPWATGGADSLQSKFLRFFAPRKQVTLHRGACKHANKMIRRLLMGRGQGFLFPTPLEEVLRQPHERTGLGYPVFSSKPVHLERVNDISRLLLRELTTHRLLSLPFVAVTRGASAGPFVPANFRAAFGSPRAVQDLERMIFDPLFARLSLLPQFAAWSSSRAVEESVTGILDATDNDFTIFSVDFQNFDASIPMEVLRHVWEQIRVAFTPTAHALVTALGNHFMLAGVITPDGLFEGRTGGIPSGSVMTNLIGSLVNIWVMHYAAHASPFPFNNNTVKGCVVQGDDGVYLLQRMVPEEVLIEVLASHLGVVMSPKKSDVAVGEAHFLQNVYKYSYVHSHGYTMAGVRPIMRVLNSMMSYSSWRPGWSAAMDSLRWRQQMEACVSHPSFSAFAAWYAARDKFGLQRQSDLVQLAGGVDHVAAALPSTAWNNKPSIRQAQSSAVEAELAKLR